MSEHSVTAPTGKRLISGELRARGAPTERQQGSDHREILFIEPPRAKQECLDLLVLNPPAPNSASSRRASHSEAARPQTALAQLGGANDVKRLSASGPFSAQGSQQRPDDGWRMRASTTGPVTNAAHSICLQTNALAFRYPRKEVVLHGGQARKIVVRRPKKKGWRVVGGGAGECSWTSRARSPGTARTRARPPTTAGWCAPALRTWRPSPWS